MPSTFPQNIVTNPSQSYLLLSGQSKRLKVEFKNSNEVYYDPYSLSLLIYKPDSTQYFSETYSLASTIKKEATGRYYIDFTGDTTLTGDYQFVWAWQDIVNGEAINGFQMVSLAPVQCISSFAYLRNQIDKARKDLNSEFGYNDEQLFMYLKGALSEINRVPPSTDLTFVTFPWSKQQQLIIDVATFVALQSQGLVAIDTDSNYSMNGNSFTVDHWSKISAYLSMLQTRVRASMISFKLGYLTRGGSVKVERGAGYRQMALWNAAPTGTNLGGYFPAR